MRKGFGDGSPLADPWDEAVVLARALVPSSAAHPVVVPFRFLRLLPLCVLLLLSLAHCGERTDAPEHVARVGDQYLRPNELHEALQQLPAEMDSTAARHQVIRQWTTTALLYQEAQRRGLANDSAVKKRLEESRRSVLVNALLGEFYDEMPDTSSTEAMRNYFERHRKALRYSVPHVRVRHLSTRREAEARTAHQRLQQAIQAGNADSVWTTLVRRYASDTAYAHRLADDFSPEPNLFSNVSGVTERLEQMEKNELAPVFEAGDGFHVLQLIERVPAGTVPEFEWVEDEIRQRLLLQRRKQMYARQVERLRNQARSSGELEGLE